MQLAQLRRSYHRIRDLGADVVAIGPDSVESFAAFFDERGIPFQGLSDTEGKVLERFGQEVKVLKMGRLPAVVVLDGRGIVRFTHYGRKTSDIPSADTIVQEILTIKSGKGEFAIETLGSEYDHRPEETENSEEEIWDLER